MVVNSRSEKDAEAIVKELCDELRIFNHVVSNCTIKATRKF
jgi:phosphoribosylformylglycinamidine (FGAM) synthase PurS component